MVGVATRHDTRILQVQHLNIGEGHVQVFNIRTVQRTGHNQFQRVLCLVFTNHALQLSTVGGRHGIGGGGLHRHDTEILGMVALTIGICQLRVYIEHKVVWQGVGTCEGIGSTGECHLLQRTISEHIPVIGKSRETRAELYLCKRGGVVESAFTHGLHGIRQLNAFQAPAAGEGVYGEACQFGTCLDIDALQFHIVAEGSIAQGREFTTIGKRYGAQ